MQLLQFLDTIDLCQLENPILAHVIVFWWNEAAFKSNNYWFSSWRIVLDSLQISDSDFWILSIETNSYMWNQTFVPTWILCSPRCSLFKIPLFSKYLCRLLLGIHVLIVYTVYSHSTLTFINLIFNEMFGKTWGEMWAWTRCVGTTCMLYVERWMRLGQSVLIILSSYFWILI